MELPLVSVLSITSLVKCICILYHVQSWGFAGMALEFFEKLLQQLDIIIFNPLIV